MWWQLLLIQVGFFFVLLVVLQKLFHGNLLSAISRVQSLQRQNLKKEKELKTFEERIKLECETKIREMNEEVSQQRKIAEREIKAYKGSIAGQVEEEKRVMLANILEKEKNLQKRFDDETKRRSIAAAMRILDNAFSPKMKELLHHVLVEELLESLSRMDASKPHADAAALQIKSAYPFSSSEKAKLKRVLSLSSDEEIKETQ